mmetsp:Transcript_58938/g.144171  ORF Transcript_58938/g.144171 Transcript_58938/m.144171 type:complete len:99 (+) Transcript_58938:760-1056(+)
MSKIVSEKSVGSKTTCLLPQFHFYTSTLVFPTSLDQINRSNLVSLPLRERSEDLHHPICYESTNLLYIIYYFYYYAKGNSTLGREPTKPNQQEEKTVS